MKYWFDPESNAFYPEALKEEYTDAGSLPDNLIEVGDKVFIEFTGIPPEGKTRGVGERGLPVWINVPPLTVEDEIKATITEKKLRVDIANDYINGQQWPSKLVLGRLSDNEKLQFNEWLDYLDAVNAVDTSTAPDIKWPTQPEQQAS